LLLTNSLEAMRGDALKNVNGVAGRFEIGQ
jgi:hypothetical protein